MKRIAAVLTSLAALSINILEGQSLSPAYANKLLRSHFTDTNFIIIDVCTDAAYSSRHLQNAIHHYVYSASFSSDLDAMDKSKIYLLTCTSGSMSASAMGTMTTKSFQHVYDISGGLNNWTSLGYKSTTRTTESIIRFKSNAEFSDLLSLATDPVIIDLRNDTSFQRKHLINAQHIDTLKHKIETLFPDKTKTYFIYGDSTTSNDTTLLYVNLYQNGYEKVYFLKNGIRGWIDSKLPYYEYSGPIDTTSLLLPAEICLSTHIYGGSLVIEPDFPDQAFYSLYSMDSKLIAGGSIIGITTIPVNTYPYGLYILKIDINGTFVTKKLFIR